MNLFLAILPMMVGMAAAAPDTFPRVRTTLVENEFVTRVPVRPRPAPPRFVWQEQKGPRCIVAGNIRGALLSGTEHVDLVMASKRRIRAKLDSDCPALDFYEGFYLSSPDQLICAGRNVVRSRMGGRCPIASFHQLVPVRRAAIP